MNRTPDGHRVRRETPHLRRRDAGFAQVNPVSAAGQGDVDAVVDHDAHRGIRREFQAAAHEAQGVTGREVQLAQLNDIDPSGDGARNLLDQRRFRVAQGDAARGGQAVAISDQAQSQCQTPAGGAQDRCAR
jgi:hypothetical protein